MLILLHPDQAKEVALLSKDLELTTDEVVRYLLSGPLLPPDRLEDPSDYPSEPAG